MKFKLTNPWAWFRYKIWKFQTVNLVTQLIKFLLLVFFYLALLLYFWFCYVAYFTNYVNQLFTTLPNLERNVHPMFVLDFLRGLVWFCFLFHSFCTFRLYNNLFSLTTNLAVLLYWYRKSMTYSGRYMKFYSYHSCSLDINYQLLRSKP